MDYTTHYNHTTPPHALNMHTRRLHRLLHVHISQMEWFASSKPVQHVFQSTPLVTYQHINSLIYVHLSSYRYTPHWRQKLRHRGFSHKPNQPSARAKNGAKVTRISLRRKVVWLMLEKTHVLCRTVIGWIGGGKAEVGQNRFLKICG